MHCETLSAFVSALIMTTGISRWSGSLLIVLRTSSPFRSGIIRSSRTRLNFSFSISAIASFPPAAQVICSRPSDSSINCSVYRLSSLSSTIRMPGRSVAIGDTSLSVRENAPQRCDQPIKFDRFGVELVAPRRERLYALAGERVRGESDNGDVASLRIALEPPCGFPAIDIGHFEVHQDDIGALGGGHCAALLAILRRQHLEIAEQLEPHLEHEDVVVVVFHVKHFGHDAASSSLLMAGLLCTSRRMRSTSSAGCNLSLTSTDCTPEFSRARSLASRSSEVMTMTGMSRQAAS